MHCCGMSASDIRIPYDVRKGCKARQNTMQATPERESRHAVSKRRPVVVHLLKSHHPERRSSSRLAETLKTSGRPPSPFLEPTSLQQGAGRQPFQHPARGALPARQGCTPYEIRQRRRRQPVSSPAKQGIGRQPTGRRVIYSGTATRFHLRKRKGIGTKVHSYRDSKKNRFSSGAQVRTRRVQLSPER